MRDTTTKKASEQRPSAASLKALPETDFENVRVRKNPYSRRIGARGRRRMIADYERATKTRILDDDLAELFPDSRAVNQALRTLTELARRIPKPKRRRAA